MVIFAIFIIIGLYLGKRFEFGFPNIILEGWLEGRNVRSYLISVLKTSIVLGVLIGIVIIGFDFLFSPFFKEIPEIP